MAAKNRVHLGSNLTEPLKVTPRHLSKQEFAQRLYQLMLEKKLNQSNLGRRAGIQRNAISTYMRGRSLPTHRNLIKLARVLGMKPEELLPNTIESAIDADNPMVSMQVSPSAPTKAWLRINQLVDTKLAVKILEMLQDADNDNAAKRN